MTDILDFYWRLGKRALGKSERRLHPAEGLGPFDPQFARSMTNVIVDDITHGTSSEAQKTCSRETKEK